MFISKLLYLFGIACAIAAQQNALENTSDGSKDMPIYINIDQGGNEVSEKDLQKFVDLLFQNKSLLKFYAKNVLENTSSKKENNFKPISDTEQHRIKRQELVGACPRGWSTHGSSCYLLVNIERNWDDASSSCKEAGGDLATSTTEETNNYLSSLVQSNELYFLGLQYVGKLGYFKWNDGRVLNWNNWYGESPVNNPAGRECVAIMSDGFWRDVDCNSQHRYVCEAAPAEAVEMGLDDSEGDTGTSTIYTRWGRTECPASAEVVYQGIVGGAHFNQPGSGANYLCMPLKPIYNETRIGTQNRGRLYGAEYQIPAFPSLSHLHNHSPPCVVCQKRGRSIAMMVPARNVCPEKWKLEYSGWLMSARYNHETRTEYICVDREPEIMPDTASNVNGILLYLVESMCTSGGGLPCVEEGYAHGRELTCALCTI